MRRLKRSECVILPLVLKRRWYNMIEIAINEPEHWKPVETQRHD